MPGSSPQSVASAVYAPGAQRVCCRCRSDPACSPTPARTADRKAGAWGRLPRSHPHQLGSGRGYRLMLSFDNLDHDLLMKALRKHCQERWILLYVDRWLKVPMQTTDGQMLARDRGTPQGG